MTYEQLAAFAQTWGMLMFVAGFALVCVYALWPGNREKFRRAASAPLADDGE
jgi:cytochrome c oxidase cbb3-type subunit IV